MGFMDAFANSAAAQTLVATIAPNARQSVAADPTTTAAIDTTHVPHDPNAGIAYAGQRKANASSGGG